MIDHLVYAVPDLPTALDWFAEQTGIRPAVGGRHLTRGTHNAVVSLGDGAYLEIIAPDPENHDVAPPRWMAVDAIAKPTLTRWALKSDDLERDAALLQAINPHHGRIVDGSRSLTDGATLNWRMTLPQSEPLVELLPFLLDWSSSDFHPTERMGPGYELLDLNFGHSDPEAMQTNFARFGYKAAITEQKLPQIIARLKTPRGILRLT